MNFPRKIPEEAEMLSTSCRGEPKLTTATSREMPSSLALGAPKLNRVAEVFVFSFSHSIKLSGDMGVDFSRQVCCLHTFFIVVRSLDFGCFLKSRSGRSERPGIFRLSRGRVPGGMTVTCCLSVGTFPR